MVICLDEHKWVGDLIQISEIKKWNNGDTIFVKAPTGKGKSYFITNYLAVYCREFGKKILWLSNRILLKEQNIKISQENRDIIKIMSYQQIEYYRQQKKGPIDFDFIVADECHYFFIDSPISKKTDLSFAWLVNKKNCIKILMSATPELTENYLQRMKNYEVIKYEMEQNYSYIDNFYFYNDDEVVEKLLLKLPEGEKAIYFTSAKKAYNTNKIFKDNSSFICSKNKKEYREYSNNETKDYIIENEKFDCQILCTTSVLDNGINIKDEAVKFIIIDYFDLDIVKQCFGRKRISNENDKVNIYIKNRKNKSLNGTKQQHLKKLEQPEYLKEYGQVAFINKYGRDDFVNMIYFKNDKEDHANVRCNKMMYFKYKSDISKIEEMMSIDDGYMLAVLERFDWLGKEYKILDNEMDKITLSDLLDMYVNKKMFKDEQKEFKDFLMDELLNAPKGSHKKIGLKIINALFEYNQLDYVINSKQENSRKSENWKKTYWIVSKKLENNLKNA